MFLGQMFVIILTFQRVSVYRIKLIDSKTVHSRTFSKHNSSLAIDGNTETCSITQQDSTTEEKPWWRVELDRIYNITNLEIFVSNAYTDLFQNFNIHISSNDKDFREHLCASVTKLSFVSDNYTGIECKTPFFGNYITIERFGGPLKEMLLLCEVRLKADFKTVNLAFKRPTEQSGVLFQGLAGNSVDNNLLTCAQIRSSGPEFAWWRVILDGSYYITNVNIYFMANSTGQYAKKHVYIYVSNDNKYYEAHMCGNTEYPHNKIDEKGSMNITCKKPILGVFVTIQKFTGVRPRWLILCEVEVFSRDGPKEMEIADNSSVCLDFQYKCYEDRCIHRDLLCDGTEDCPQGDDEAPTCVSQCGKDKFKCLRRNKCIDIVARCDGIVNCPDFSDEQACFHEDMKTNFLTATFKGESDFYICSQNWKTKNSFDVCHKINRNYLATSFEPIQNKTLKYLVITNIPENSLPEMTYFQKGSPCKSGKIVKLQCEPQETAGICGTRGNPDGDYEPYIINGNKARDGAWPWQAHIILNGSYGCGGNIINKHWIMSAAHCFVAFSSLHVKVGSNIVDDPNEPVLNVSHLVMHPLYQQNHFVDLALLRLTSPMKYTKFIRPICLPDGLLSNSTLMSYRHCFTSGFGYMTRNWKKPKYLQQGRLNMLTPAQCSHHGSLVHGGFYRLENERFCAGSIPTTHGINTCMGDSGGPYMCKNEKRIWTLVGVSAATIHNKTNRAYCALSLFTKVDKYLDFVDKVFDEEEMAILSARKASKAFKEISVSVTCAIMSCYFALESLH